MNVKKINCDILDRTMFYIDDDVNFGMLDGCDLGYLSEAAALRLPAKNLYISAADRKRIVRAKAMYAKALADCKAASKILGEVYKNVEKDCNRFDRQLENEDDLSN